MDRLLSRITHKASQNFSLRHLASTAAVGVPGSLLAKQVAGSLQTIEHGLEQTLGVYGAAFAGTTAEEFGLAVLESVLTVAACAIWYFTAPWRKDLARNLTTAVTACGLMLASPEKAPDNLGNNASTPIEWVSKGNSPPITMTRISFHYRVG